MTPQFLFTCEHAAPDLPDGWSAPDWLTADLLHSHWGWDQGAADLTLALTQSLPSESYAFPITRLLIDANRKPQTALQSQARQSLTPEQCRELELRYQTYRQEIQARALQILEERRSAPKSILKIVSVHSFTPNLKGIKRKTDIGLLFRIDRPHEASFARQIKSILSANTDDPDLWRATQTLTAVPGRMAVHLNLPYRGFTDCFLNDLLDGFGKSGDLTGLMIEVNQNLLRNKNSTWTLGRWLANAFRQEFDREINQKSL